jgi:hypothetical protein
MTRQTLQQEEEPGRQSLPQTADGWWLPLEVAEELHALWRRPLSLRLRRRTPFERIVVDALRGRQPDSAGSEALVDALDARGRGAWRLRITAASLLGYVSLTDQQRGLASGALRTVVAEKDAVRRGVLWAVAAFVSQGLMVPLALMREWRRMQLQAAAIRSLGQMLDVESIGPITSALVEGRPFRKPTVRAEATLALHVLLAELTPEHYGQISGDTANGLVLLLKHRDGRLVLAALAALEKVGGGGAADVVAQLGRDRQDSPEILAESGRVLPVLMERKRLEEQASTLLRAAGERRGETVLLRPLGASGKGEANVLLRTFAEGED